MSTASTQTLVSEIEAIAQEVLAAIGAVDPALQPVVTTVEGVASLLGTLVTKALAAYQDASGVAITADSIAALMPNPTPPPTQAACRSTPSTSPCG